MIGPASRLVAALFPPAWPARMAVLDCAHRLDLKHGPGAAEVLLFAHVEHRATGHLPAAADVRELVLAFGDLLGGVRAEARATLRREGAP